MKMYILTRVAFIIMHFYYASNSEIIKVQIYEACESLNIIVTILF